MDKYTSWLVASVHQTMPATPRDISEKNSSMVKVPALTIVLGSVFHSPLRSHSPSRTKSCSDWLLTSIKKRFSGKRDIF